MRTAAIIITLLISGAIGYTIGYLSGALTGIVIYYRKSRDEAYANQILDELDRMTVWETEELD